MIPGSDGDVLARIGALGVVPVVEVDDPADAVPLAQALAEGGLPVLEITFRTRRASEAVRAVAAHVPEVLVGAGTLLGAGMVADAVDAGAAFGVSPGVGEGLLAAAAEAGLPLVPGALTPSEVMTCWAAGVRHVKLFPASSAGGPAALASLAGPFGWTGLRFMPTGGVGPQEAARYLAMPSVFAVGGSWVAPREDIAAGRWGAIRDRARAAAALRGVAAGAAS